MSITIKELQDLMMDQLRRRGFYPECEKEAILRIGEEVGELFEAIRENHSKEKVASEIVDIIWNVLRLSFLKNIDFEKAFLSKLAYNETRDLETEKDVLETEKDILETEKDVLETE